MKITLGMILGAGEVVVGAFVPGSGIATHGLIRIGRSAAMQEFVTPVLNDVMAPVVEKVGSALDLDGTTVGELAKDLYLNKTNYADIADMYPF